MTVSTLITTKFIKLCEKVYILCMYLEDSTDLDDFCIILTQIFVYIDFTVVGRK